MQSFTSAQALVAFVGYVLLGSLAVAVHHDESVIDDVRKIIATGPYYNRNAYPNQEQGKTSVRLSRCDPNVSRHFLSCIRRIQRAMGNLVTQNSPPYEGFH
ncbi:unnamed protein product [Heligmosomoides polygyrus]|uniref:Secreted protein n=1 Tax=Heligmosomoides polygyrus TaxID=6339 RepID=A0A183FDL1_HELPZ|nr:unnamed protein product [Heligmosomoides polygyrus]